MFVLHTLLVFFFQAEDGIRDGHVTGVQTCALPISDVEWARAAAEEVAGRWRQTHPSVAEKLEEDLEATLTCFAFPTSHQKRIRTTNGLERLNQEIKRRTRVVRIFPNPDSCLRLVTALCIEQSEEWVSGKRYLDMTLLEDADTEEEAREGVVELAA